MIGALAMGASLAGCGVVDTPGGAAKEKSVEITIDPASADTHGPVLTCDGIVTGATIVTAPGRSEVWVLSPTDKDPKLPLPSGARRIVKGSKLFADKTASELAVEREGDKVIVSCNNP